MPSGTLHSFPTRRSSDLDRARVEEGADDGLQPLRLRRGEATERRADVGPNGHVAQTEDLLRGGDELAAGLHGIAYGDQARAGRSEEHTSELQSPCNLVCRPALSILSLHDALPI